MKSNRISRILYTLLLLIIPCLSLADNSSDTIKTWFDTWHENRIIYNAYRDSIFAPVDRDAWVNLCIRRADAYRKMYRENKKMIDEMKAHFKRPDVPKADYDTLLSMCEKNGKGMDIFMAEDIMSILLSYYENNHKSESDLHNYLVCLYCQGSFEYQIGSVGDNLGLSLSYKMLRKAVDLGFKKGLKVNTDIQLRMVMICGIMSILSPTYVNAGLITYKECDEIMRNIRKNMNSKKWKWIEDFANTDHPENFINNRTGVRYDEDDQALLKGALALLDNYETNVFTDSYFEQWQSNPSEETKQLLKTASANVDIETLFKRKPHLISEVKWAMDQIDADEAYKRIDSLTPFGKDVDAKEILKGDMPNILAPIMSLTHILPFTSMNDTERHSKVEQYYNEFIRILRLCKGDNDIRNINSIENMVTSRNALKYLSADEKLNMLNQLMMSAQINTFAHSSHLADLAQTLVEGLVKYAPEQLVGIPGCPTVEDVQIKRDSISEFVRQAAMFHDLGKNSMAPIIANDFRPITDHEYQLIKLHPEKGLRFLRIDPSFSIYHDTTVGHHKWYNGKGGYPESFDNTKSDIRVIIDIITLCDCLEAATDAVGRNYNPTKVFANVLDEFDAQAGTRYNGDIVKVIRQNRRLYSEMERLVSPWGCYAVYYDIYKEFFREK